MNKRKKLLLTSIIALILLIIFFMGYTLAKYISSYKENYYTDIAKWSFNVIADEVDPQTQKIYLKDTAQKINLKENQIAPGTSGEFELELDATDSEVDVEYYVQVDESKNNISNLKFSVKKDGVLIDKKYDSLSELAEAEMHDVIGYTDSNKTVSYTVLWEWPFESGDDSIDTAIGESDNLNSEISITVVGTQAQK